MTGGGGCVGGVSAELRGQRLQWLRRAASVAAAASSCQGRGGCGVGIGVELRGGGGGREMSLSLSSYRCQAKREEQNISMHKFRLPRLYTKTTARRCFHHASSCFFLAKPNPKARAATMLGPSADDYAQRLPPATVRATGAAPTPSQ
ncbi:hypothetical protein OsJ_33923 [Oryza sativa Japonica Group]|uniref:Uncharacterized protein n=1 Tax=Oryza sativa subsp. japonica TaxID=39947 RepID=B9GAR3_ORYSJ|nr:hypothetical protein OsJ_33923 [Oryza sativa Japonica Group]